MLRPDQWKALIASFSLTFAIFAALYCTSRGFNTETVIILSLCLLIMIGAFAFVYWLTLSKSTDIKTLSPQQNTQRRLKSVARTLSILGGIITAILVIGKCLR